MSSDTYPGGVPALLARYEARRDPFTYAKGEGLPCADTDLAALTQTRVPPPEDDPNEKPPFRSSYHRKRFTLRQELTGASEAAYLNAILIAHLRKRTWPDHAPALFQRLWAEQSAHLLDQLDPRWLVSAVTTFGDHGATPAQRSTGLALATLFGTMKLYESERLFSGLPPDQPFALGKRARAPLPLRMDAYALADGGLDINLIARLWQEAGSDPVIAPLAHHLLTLLIDEDQGLLHRLALMRKRREARAAKRAKARPVLDVPPLRHGGAWGVVATIKAEAPLIRRFAAHHLALGATEIHIYLDAPIADPAALSHPQIHVTLCDSAYYQAIGKPRPEAHQLRQALNATRTLRAVQTRLDWLLHCDVDEFLIPHIPVAEALAQVLPDAAHARVAPVEALAAQPPTAFKRAHADAGQPKSVLQEIYPTFGLHLYAGFLSHTSGKVFARTGIEGARLGIHALKYKSQDPANTAKLPGLSLAHFHAPNWRHFRDHLDFRITHGAYRPRGERREMGQTPLFDFLKAEGEPALRGFFDEVCADTPALRARLQQHDMLVTHRFDFDATTARIFGAA